MADTGGNAASQKDKLELFRKDIGRKYLDGLISDKEYEILLRDKEIELGIGIQEKPAEEKGPECPTCGALVNSKDTECAICGTALIPVLVELPTAHPAPEKFAAPDNWREEWVDKSYWDLPPQELLKLPPEALKGISKGESSRMKSAFNIRTLEDFSKLKYLVWAQELSELRDDPSSFRRKDFEQKLNREYVNKELDEILKAPIYALQGVSEGDAKKLKKAFNVKTIDDLGNLKYLNWARQITQMAQEAEKQTAAETPEERYYERVCPTCGASVSEVDVMCNVCGSKVDDLAPVGAALDLGIGDTPDEDGKVCPSCGAFVDNGATQCMICETPFDSIEEKTTPAVIPPSVPEPEKMAPEQKKTEKKPEMEDHRVCPSCGAYVDDDATECIICETPFDILEVKPTPVIPLGVPGEGKAAPEQKTPEREPEMGEIPQESEQNTCPSCGAAVEQDAAQCPICDATFKPVRVAVVPVQDRKSKKTETAPPAQKMKKEKIPVIEELSPEPVHKICPSCGAAVEQDATECIICETPFDLLEVEPVPAMPPEKTVAEIAEPGQKTPEREPEIVEEIPQEPLHKICQSCGAYADEDATECLICETPFDSVERITAPAFIPPGEPEKKMIDRELEEDAALEPVQKICPSCGAAAEQDAAQCPICDATFEPAEVMPILAPLPDLKKTQEPVKDRDIEEIEELDISPRPEKEEKVCPSCGAYVDPDATECLICETPLTEAGGQPVPTEEEEKIIEAPKPVEPKQEIICEGCGAVLGEGDEECFICGARFGEPVMEAQVPEALETPAESLMPQKQEIICEGCGAVLGEGDEECFICGAKLGEPIAVAPVPRKTAEPVPEDILPEKEEIMLGDNEIMCPSCSSVIPADSDKCPECWNDLSLYVKCPSCSKLTPAGEETCRECFASLGILVSDLEPEAEEEVDALIPTEEFEVTEELREEMTVLETEEEQGRECLVCGAIFGPEDELFCPICGMEFGTVIEEPTIPESAWEDVLEVEIPPTVHTCPSCGENVTGLEATDREIREGHWFYRGLVTIFIGIFFTSFSIYARGVSAENASLGLHPPPTDVLVNILGWILVIFGFIFWLISWRLHNERQECPHCGIETDPNMAICINCGTELIAEDEEEPAESAEEEPTDEQEISVHDQYDLLSEKPLQYGLPTGESPEIPEEVPEEPINPEEVPEIPEEEPEEPIIPEEVPEIPEEAPEVPAIPEETKTLPLAEPEHHLHGEELPVEHEEHRKCPGCGIFVDITDTVCPICDTELAPEKPKAVDDKDIDIPTEEEELANLDLTEPTMDNITLPDSPAEIECPSCGASLQAGTKSCPVCEYTLN
jgi:hypothetical protein